MGATRLFSLTTFILLFMALFSGANLTAQTSGESNELIDLMDVMLDDFLNPRRAPVEREPQQNRPSQKQTVPQIEDDDASALPYTPYVPRQTLPQTAQPSFDAYDDWYYEQKPQTAKPQPIVPKTVTPNPIPEYVPPAVTPTPPVQAQSDSAKTKALIIPPPQSDRSAQTADAVPPLPPSATEQKVETTPPVQNTEAQKITQTSEPEPILPVTADGVAIDSEEYTDDDDFDEEITLSVEEEDVFDRVTTLAFSPLQFNSYNSSFGSIGVDFAFERAVKHNASFGLVGGVHYAYSQTGAKDRTKDLFKGNFKNHLVPFKDAIFTAEAALFYRFYIMNDAMKEARSYPFGFFLQPEIGVAVGFNRKGLVADQLNLKPSPLASLRTGYRGYIGDSFFIEPYVRVGYPFIAGGGIGIGVQL